MGSSNYFDQFDAPVNPTTALDRQGKGLRNQIDQSELSRQPSLNSRASSEARTAAGDAAMIPDRRRQAKADADRAQSEAMIAAQKADEAKAEQAIASMAPNSNLQGQDYLNAMVPPSRWNLVKAYARGDLGSRSGGLSTSMLPLIQDAMNYDHSASGTNFPARVKMQSALADTSPNGIGGGLRAMEQMLLHGQNVLHAGAALNNYGPGIIGSISNTVRTAYERHADDPTVAAYDKAVENYAPESQKAIAGTAGGVPEREQRQASYDASMSQASRVAGLQADARMAFERAGAINGQFKRVMGRDITDMLSPQAQEAYNEIMAGGYDKATGKPLYPAQNFIPLASHNDSLPGGPSAPPQNGGPGVGGPQSGGTPPALMANGPDQQQALATGAYREVPDEQANALLNAMLRSGSSDDQINAALKAIGHEPIDPTQTKAARDYLAKNPGYTGGFGGATKWEQQSLLNRVAASPVGTSVGAGIDAGMGGMGDEATGLVNWVRGKGNLSDLIVQADAAKQAAYATNPRAAFWGNAAGNFAGMAGVNTLLKGTALAANFAKAAPYAESALWGGIEGAGQNNNNRLDGAGIGIVSGLAGTGAGQLAAVPVGALARSAPGQFVINNAVAGTNRVRGMMGRNLINVPPPAATPSPADLTIGQFVGKSGYPDIKSVLTNAASRNAPFMLADTSPEMTSLAGAVARRSPTASGIASDALNGRNAMQIDRLARSVNDNLGPVGNIPQVSQDLMTQARAASGPLYDAAYSAPGASSVNLDDLINRPSMQAGLKRAYSIAKEEGRDPTALGFNLDNQGEVTLGRVPSFQTLDYVKRGLDDTLEQHRDPITGKLQLNEATRAINNTKNALLNRIDQVNPDYAAARSAYAGPAQARDAMSAGQDAFSLSPDEVRLQAGNMTPDNLSQMQLGFRSQLMNRANGIRDVSNPWEATLGNPNARARVDAVYPANPDNQNLFDDLGLERQMANTRYDVLGNSKTAQNSIADQAFADPGNIPGKAFSYGLAAKTGGLSGLAHAVMPDATQTAWKLGLGKQAVRKADDLAPILFNPDPTASSQTVDSIMKRLADYSDYVQAMRPTQKLGMFGSSLSNATASGY